MKGVRITILLAVASCYVFAVSSSATGSGGYPADSGSGYSCASAKADAAAAARRYGARIREVLGEEAEERQHTARTADTCSCVRFGQDREFCVVAYVLQDAPVITDAERMRNSYAPNGVPY